MTPSTFATFLIAAVLIVAAPAGALGAEKVHELKPSPSTVHRGFFDSSLKPVLTIEFGRRRAGLDRDRQPSLFRKPGRAEGEDTA